MQGHMDFGARFQISGFVGKTLTATTSETD